MIVHRWMPRRVMKNFVWSPVPDWVHARAWSLFWEQEGQQPYHSKWLPLGLMGMLLGMMLIDSMDEHPSDGSPFSMFITFSILIALVPVMVEIGATVMLMDAAGRTYEACIQEALLRLTAHEKMMIEEHVRSIA